MKCRLKNKELQAKLEAIDSKFGEKLSLYFDSCDGETSFSLLDDSEDEFSLTIYNSAIEEVHEYDPKTWNYWPAVRPTKIGFYRVEIKDPDFSIYHYVMLWNNDMWHHIEGRIERLNLEDGQEVRFKPWDDEEPDEDDEEEE